jgi:uncharacterized cupin superfamily protein
MKRINLASADYAYETGDPAGFRSGMLRTGPGLGAQRTGASAYRLPPGEAICPYHYEYGEEEWLLVLSGRPSLRHPGGTDVLEPLDLVYFAEGPEGAHLVRNETDSDVHVIMFSTRSHPAMAVYPDSGKIGVWTGNKDDDVLARRPVNVDYWDGEASTAAGGDG